MQVSKLVIACAALSGLMATGIARAEEDGAGSIGVDVTSAYIFRGGTINDEINVNPTIEATVKGLTLGTWGNFNTDVEQFDEVDLYAGYDLPLKASPVGVSLGYTEYIYPGLTLTDADGAVAVNTDADREVSTTLAMKEEVPLAPSLLVAYGIEGPYLEDGLYLQLSGEQSVPMGKDLAVVAGAALGYEAGDNYAENGFSHLTLTLGTDVGPMGFTVGYVVETDEDVLAVDEDFFMSVGATL